MAINTTSSTNTPQATDDSYSTTENFLLAGNTLILDVMSNDLGGKAKALWSIDDGNGNPVDPENLLSSDIGDGWETTALGNQIRIVNGKIEYKVGSAGTIDGLGAGQILEDSFTYAIRLGNGTLSFARVTVSVVGNNDTPTVVGSMGGSVTEDASPTTLTTTVSVDFNDVDVTDLLGYSFVKSSGALGGTLSAPVANDSGAGAAGSVSYTYSVANAATQYLAAGQTATETFTITANDGNLGTVSQLVTVTVTGTNDAPTGTDGSVTTNEDTAVTLNTGNFGFSDPIDSPADSLAAVRISTLPTGGTLLLNGVAVTAGQTISASNISSGLLSYSPAANANGTASFTFQVQDNGGTANSGVDLDQSPNTLTINITAVADLTAMDDSFSTAEDTVLNASVATNDSTTSGGTLSYALASAASFGTALVNADGSFSYTPNLNYNGADSFSYLVTDAASGEMSTQTVTLDVTAVNDAPVNTLPASFTTDEDSALRLAGLSIADVDAGSGTITVTLSASAGALMAATADGVTVTPVSGSGGSSITLSGTLADINTYLGTVANQPIYTPAADVNGIGYLSMTTDDGGATGTGGALSDIDNSTIFITPVNDAPVNAPLPVFIINEDTPRTLAGLQVADVDAGSGTITVTLSVSAGTLTTTTANGVTVTGSGGSSIVLSGNLAHINTYLSTGGTPPTYTPVANANGPVTLTMTTNDGGNSGTGAALSDTDTVTLNINAINDAPVNTLPASFTTNEDTAFKLAGLSVADVDAGSGLTMVTLSVSAGTLTAATADGVTVTNSGGSLISLSGTLANINTYLGSVANQPTYTPVANTNGAVTLTMSTDDFGNTGIDPGLTGTATSEADTDTSTIKNAAINDSPTVVSFADGMLTEDASDPTLNTSVSVNFNDVDLSDLLSYSFVKSSGTLGGTLTAPVANDSGAGAAGSVSYTYSVANAATQYLAAGQTATETFTITANDGNGGTVSQLVTVTITGQDEPVVNVAPTAVADLLYVSNSGTVASFSAATLLANDRDPDGLALQIQSVGSAVGITGLSLTNGVISFTNNLAGDATGSFSYTINDGLGGTSTATVTVSSIAVTDNQDTINLGAVGVNYQGSYIDAMAGADSVTGVGNGGDVLIGGAGADTLIGGNGNDILRGGAGNNGQTMDGGAGIDLLDFSDGTAALNFTLVQSAGNTSIANGMRVSGTIIPTPTSRA